MTGGIGIGFVKFSVPKTKLRLLAQCLMKRKLLNFLLLVNYLSRIISSLVTAPQNPVLRPDQILQTHADGMPRYGHQSSSRFGLCNPTHGEHSHLTEEDVAVLWRGGYHASAPSPSNPVVSIWVVSWSHTQPRTLPRRAQFVSTPSSVLQGST